MYCLSENRIISGGATNASTPAKPIASIGDGEREAEHAKDDIVRHEPLELLAPYLRSGESASRG